MALVNFIYEGIKTTISCLKEDKMKIICNKFTSKIQKNINSLYFVYDGNKINYELTFYEQANSSDRLRLEMNILVYKINGSNELIFPGIDYNLHNNFNVQFRLQYHKDTILCATILKDGRFATCSADESIIIYDNKTFKPDLIIKEHNGGITYIFQLSTGMLATCSKDRTIKIFYIKNNNYDVFQILNNHKESVNKMIELNNKKLVSCSRDSSVMFYSNNNDKYIQEFQINTDKSCWCLIQTKDNEICYYISGGSIVFYNLIDKIIIKRIDVFLIANGYNFMNMITKDLLLITGEGKISIINVNKYNIVRTIHQPDSVYINISCSLNKNIILTGDFDGTIKLWKLEDDNLKLISKKFKAHDKGIFALIKLNNGHILSGSVDRFIKIW